MVDIFGKDLVIRRNRRLNGSGFLHCFLVMTTEQKIEAAHLRVKELQLLIRHWEASQASSKHVALELIEGIVNEDYESNAA